MSTSNLAVILSTVACLVSSGAASTTETRSEEPIAAVAGDYYFGDGLGLNCSLRIRSDGRFSFTRSGCGGVYDQNFGVARMEAGHLILNPKRPNVREGFKGMDTDLVPARWGDRLYLIPESQGRKFSNLVNQGDEPRNEPHGLYYLRGDDWKKKVSGLPSVPKEWEPMLLKTPLRGRIIEVLEGDRARVDLGAVDGVWTGLELWANTVNFDPVQVVEVDATSCIISAKYPGGNPIHFRKGQSVALRDLDVLR